MRSCSTRSLDQAARSLRDNEQFAVNQLRDGCRGPARNCCGRLRPVAMTAFGLFFEGPLLAECGRPMRSSAIAGYEIGYRCGDGV